MGGLGTEVDGAWVGYQRVYDPARERGGYVEGDRGGGRETGDPGLRVRGTRRFGELGKRGD